MTKKILFAVGGTGGHLFPAQSLAKTLLKMGPYEILFAGGKLGTNPFFDQKTFPFKEIKSSSPFRTQIFKAFTEIGKGFFESQKLLKEFAPDLVIGFGSFYSFPILVSASVKKVPFILAETNVLPGKVNRLFASRALFSIIQFPESKKYIKGDTKLGKYLFQPGIQLSKKEARKAYHLAEDKFTLLVFGGSQGAETINQAVQKLEGDFQILHFCGKNQNEELLKKSYQEKGIQAVVKPFENQMYLAWQAADLAICRAGAATMSEMLKYHVPAIMIPWPGATDNHQQLNAEVMESIGGAILLSEAQIDTLPEVFQQAQKKIPTMVANLKGFYESQQIEDFSNLVVKEIEKLSTTPD